MRKTLKYTTFALLFLIIQAGCKSKKAVVANKRTPRVVIENTKPKPVVEKTVVTTPSSVPKKVVAPAAPTGSYADVVANYIATYSDIAKEEMIVYGIPASITLAQGILESGAGRGALTSKAQNHFGIKCHQGWTGDRVYHDDDEAQECFRKYDDPNNSFRDHSLFLTQRSRYKSLFNLDKQDYKGWAKGLRKAGYATDPKYPNKLIGIIERYNLTAYDEQALGLNTSISDQGKSQQDAAIQSYVVKKGDTLYSISRKYKLPVDDLKRINGLSSNDISIGQTLYLQSQ